MTFAVSWSKIAEFGPLVAWGLIYAASLCLGHAALRTNAFDLSVFDYALWSTLAGRVGDVPFIGHSLFSHHFMPTLLALLPVYAVWPSAWLLILVQLGGVVAAWFLCRAVFRSLAVPAFVSSALLFAFLFSRRSHSAVTHAFYIESLEPAFVLWMIWSWLRGRRGQYWTALLLALGCKEDMALYVGAFGMLLACERPHRRLGLTTAVVAAVWLGMSVLVLVPAVRQAEGLSASYPFFEARYQATDETSAAEAISRILTVRSVGKVINLTSTVAFSCFAAPGWLLVVLPGIAANLAARADTLQSAFLAHYSWPILPWLFVAGAVGLTRLWRRSWRAGLVAVLLIWLMTIVDSPLWRTRLPTSTDLSTARAIRQALHALPDEAAVWVAPNLLPHIRHRSHAYTIGSSVRPARVDVLAFATFGNLWPLDDGRLVQVARVCDEDPRVSRRHAMHPLAVFVLKDGSASENNDSRCLQAVRSLGGATP